MAPLRHPLWASVGGFLVGLLAARFVAAGGFFEDALALCMWSLPLIALTGLVAISLAGRLQTAAAAAGASVAIGAVLASGWTFGVAKILGPWFGAFGSPVLLLYAVASVNGLFTALVLSPRRWAIPLSVASGLAFALIGIPGTTWLVVRLTDQRRVEVLTLRWTPGAGELAAVPFMDGKAFGNLSAEDLDALRPICPGGRLELISASGSNPSHVQRFGRPLRVLVAFESDAIEPATVALPRGERVAVAYRNGSWVVHPPGPPGPRRLHVGPPDTSLGVRHPVAHVDGP